MPFCGFDKEMLDGLDMFYQGLIKAIERKTKEKKTTPESTINTEINEMDEFIGELDNLKNQNDQQALKGAAHLAQAFYKAATNSNPGFEDTYCALASQKKHLRKLFYTTDEIYEKECKKKPNPMKNLVNKLNNMMDE
ncbi:MAG: hypothetical protein KKF46_07140 [Nanoarchaeota archaeon]|nr:hypothetical protein [Nanoarchaeota archaeon]MBU1322103.1 hypothetical protein [Nanoarchaeota archaeon]MBU1598053.1 hypothetical protein [Nanoarchaeota archaeon]MBU2440757.1 hypothetical protein [Nanoarchaeota archaeon]